MKETDKWLVVVNPKAGTGKCEKDWPRVKEMLLQQGFSFLSVLTERPFHAIEITRNMVNDLGFKKIIAVGGAKRRDFAPGLWSRGEQPMVASKSSRV